MNEKQIFALGFFDGVHLGHQALLKACCRLAEERGCQAAAASFDMTPSAVLQNQPPRMINTAHDRVSLLRQYGIGPVHLYKADQRTLSWTWQQFLDDLLRCGATGFVCGNDYRFGKGGAGNAVVLQEFCKERSLPCEVLPEQTLDGSRISSTRIRSLLEEGRVEQANRLLGHPHILTGTVVHGKQLGRTIGIPTANLLLPPELVVPKFGVYACKAFAEGKWYPAVTNIGTRPTVNGTGITVEPWLLDFSGDLYGKPLRLEFHSFLRPETKFQSLAELQAEIRKNAGQTRNFFKKSE